MIRTAWHRLALRAAALLLAAAAGCASAPAGRSPGAPAPAGAASAGSLAPLDGALEPLRTRFDAGAGRPRLLVLASPT